MQSPKIRQKSSLSNQPLIALLLVPALLLPGCSTLGYYGQAIGGHLEITFKRRAIDRLLADDDTPPALRERLRTVEAIRAFAVRELALPDSGSYTAYSELDRDVTTWLVVAAPPFSLEPRRWCFPIAGCVPYRGYFSRERATREARRLADKGLETTLSPAIAYSTLGWMDDPVLSTMLAYDDLTLAGLIFHELAHERVYLPGDARFNESYASAVEKLGRERFASARALAVDKAAVARRERRAEQFTTLLLAARARLAGIYASDRRPAAMRAAKAAVLAELEEDFRDLRARWDGYTGFDHWFAKGPPNNARLSLLATYELDVPAFETLFARSGRDFAAFHRAVEALAALPDAEREARLAALAGP